MKIVNAKKEHKDFILDANKKINDVSGLSSTKLDVNIDNDLFCKKPKFKCLVAVVKDRPVAMCIYSEMYMANHGLGYYLANVYVEPDQRNKNIFKKFLEKINSKGKYNFMMDFVGDENETMKKIMSKLGANDTGLKPYFLKLKKD